MSKVFVRGRLLWVAWYPLRGRKSQVRVGRARNRFLEVAVGPAYLLLGSGTPEV